MARTNHEAAALERFRALVQERNITAFSGQGIDNRICIERNVYHQFGDLRVELESCTLIVEVESAGGVGNLVKYWESYEKKRLTKPMKLLHLFRKKTTNDYEAHRVVWEFLAATMRQTLGERFQGTRLTYANENELGEAVSVFGQWLDAKRV